MRNVGHLNVRAISHHITNYAHGERAETRDLLGGMFGGIYRGWRHFFIWSALSGGGIVTFCLFFFGEFKPT